MGNLAFVSARFINGQVASRFPEVRVTDQVISIILPQKTCSLFRAIASMYTMKSIGVLPNMVIETISHSKIFVVHQSLKVTCRRGLTVQFASTSSV